MTEKQHRELKRECELDDRARKILDKEKRKKENKLKRLKKEEKEREQRRKAGLPEKPDGYISPRQCRLGMFFGKDQEGQSVESGGNVAERDDGECGSKEGYGSPSMEGLYWPGSTLDPHFQEENSLQGVRPKRPTQTLLASEKLSQPVEGLDSPSSAQKDHLHERKALQGVTSKNLSQALHAAEKLSQITEWLNWPSTTSEDNCHKGKVLQEVKLNRLSQVHCVAAKLSQVGLSKVLPDDVDWLALLPSNSQVERELSPSTPTPRPAQKSPHGNLPSGVRPAAVMIPALVEEILPFFSTQDLEFTTEELEELVAPAKQMSSTQESFEFGVSGLSTQELLELPN